MIGPQNESSDLWRDDIGGVWVVMLKYLESLGTEVGL